MEEVCVDVAGGTSVAITNKIATIERNEFLVFTHGSLSICEIVLENVFPSLA